MLRLTRHDLIVQGKGVRTGLPKPLEGGLELGTGGMPRAAGRNGSRTRVELSYPLARGCTKLLAGDMGTVELIGSDSSPTGLHVLLANGKSHCWVVPEETGKDRVLALRGMPFSSQLVNYNAGLAIGLFLLLHREAYPDFASAAKAAVDAATTNDTALIARSVAAMADEMAYCIEQMISDNDPLGLCAVILDRERPEGDYKTFDGGDLIKQAFVDPDAFSGLINTADANTRVLQAVSEPSHSFVGDLLAKLSDCIIRGKHVLLTGPTATGKTLAVEEACMDLGAPHVVIRGSEGLEDRDLIASVSLEEGNTVTRYGPVPEAMILGRKQYELHVNEMEAVKRENREPVRIPPAVLLIDEVNRLQTRHQNFLVSMLNIRKSTRDYYLRIPDTNEEITCPDGFFVVVAARNIGSAFAGTNTMDLALERRFYKKIDLQYLPPEHEAALVQSRTGLDENLTNVLVKVAQDTRFQLSQLKAPLDTDTLLKWAEELAWLKFNGGEITDQTVIETARDVIFDICLERSERGGFDPAGEAVLTDNIGESWRDGMQEP